MKLVVVSNLFPLPADSGGPIRVDALTRALAADHDVHLLALRRDSTTPGLIARFEQETGATVDVFDRDAQAGFMRRWSRAITSGTPTFILSQRSEALAAQLRHLAPGADAVVFLDDYAAGYASEVAASVPVVIDKHNVMGWSMRQAERSGGARGRARDSLAHRLVGQFESRAVARADAVVVTSQDESDRLGELYGRSADAVVPGAVDLPSAPSQRATQPVVAWLGLHAYAPNAEGLVRFVEEGWDPLGREGWRLLVAGANPPPQIQALAERPGVEVLGFVEDLDALCSRCCAAVVPLWRGAGVKLKTLTFMAAGLPVAGTSVAFEGIAAESGRHGLIAEDPAGMAGALRQIHAEPDLADRLAREARALVERSHTWQGLAPRFVAVVEAVGRDQALRASTSS